MINIILNGACGRMGRQVYQNAASFDSVVVAGYDYVSDASLPFPVYSSFKSITEKADVIIDFSAPATLKDELDFAVEKKLPVVLCATGYTPDDLALISEAAKSIPVFRSANVSLGVQVLKILCRKAAEMLPGFDIEIVEKHHNQKKDAPSGTALLLYDAVKKDDTIPTFGRDGKDCKRVKEEIGLHAIRGGTVAGEHEVGYYGPQETILLTHSAQDRSVFAFGALRCAAFLIGREPGEYNMDDMMK